MRKKYHSLVIVGLILVTVIFAVSIGLARLRSNSSQQLASRQIVEKETEECPLNGKFYTKKQQDIWQKRRPLGIMVDNAAGARPQSGLSEADVVYEAAIEAGVTRFLAVYYCQSSEIVGPVRSVRTYFLDVASEYGSFPLIAHVGGANTPGRANALGQIKEYGWGLYNDLDQFKIGFPTFWADYDRTGKDVATEHAIYTSTLRLWDLAARERKLTNQQIDRITRKGSNWDEEFRRWKFKSDLAYDQRSKEFAAEIAFYSGRSATTKDYMVVWQYDPKSNSYLRLNGGQKLIDQSTGEQLAAKTVVLLQMKTYPAGDGYIEEGLGYHLVYGTIGRGVAEVLMDGKVVEGTWSKKSRTNRTMFLDEQGDELSFNRGLIWVELLPSGHTVTFGVGKAKTVNPDNWRSF
ncbi:MAG: hypothetical protein UY21_C0009G0026 [Microgenomates group bacterium GW2011_GWA1_48_10]|nr:MAG: hypothetical protein UY21_C0009G0026 [Microgenomates group bacterium GW2011_GWA1_48_10]